MKVENFNIRVYGILSNLNGEILVTDEFRNGMNMTKFVGGGLEKGEGIADGLKREFREEMGIEIEVKALFYLNDFLQISTFNPKDQLISIYYQVTTADWHGVQKSIDNPTLEQSFKWVRLKSFSEDNLTFPIDKVVLNKLKTELKF